MHTGDAVAGALVRSEWPSAYSWRGWTDKCIVDKTSIAEKQKASIPSLCQDAAVDWVSIVQITVY